MGKVRKFNAICEKKKRRRFVRRAIQKKITYLLFGLLIFIKTTSKTNTDSVGNISDTLAPNEFVQLGIDSYVLGSHHLSRELLDGTNGTRCLLLECTSEETLVKIDRVITSHNLRGFLSVCLRHSLLHFNIKLFDSTLLNSGQCEDCILCEKHLYILYPASSIDSVTLFFFKLFFSKYRYIVVHHNGEEVKMIINPPLSSLFW